jgi:hypothetical protein
LENAHEIGLLTPPVSTRNTVFFMNTNNLAALGAGPSFHFVSNKKSYAKFPYVYEIVNHTHTVLGSIALIQVIQPAARKTVTTKAVPGSTLHYLLAVFDSTVDAGF